VFAASLLFGSIVAHQAEWGGPVSADSSVA
jgi:hypothetical protein